MPLELLITDDEYIPIYQQLVHQIGYLITSRELAPDAQLPSVRTLADTLNINPSTVAQAYRALQNEGMIDSQRGRGTFVKALPDEAARYSTRQALLTQKMEEVVTQGFALGFDAATIRQNLARHLQQHVRTLPIILVAPTIDTAEKYAALITQGLTKGFITTVIPCAIHQLEAEEPWLLEAYKHTYFTAVAFMNIVPKAETIIRQHGIQSEVIGLTAKVHQDTIQRLRELDPHAPYTLMTEAKNVNSSLSILGKYSPLDLHTINIVTELSGPKQLHNLKNSYVIYTFNVIPLVEQQEIPPSQRLELAFTLSDDSYTRLRDLAQSRPLLTSTP